MGDTAMTQKGRFRWWLAAVAIGAALLLWIGEIWAQSAAGANAQADAEQLAASNGLLFDSELQTFRLLPRVLSEYPDVAALLGSGASAAAVNDRLERLARQTSAAAIYVLRPDGLTVAASNHRLPTSFVGQNYAFRPYFRDALRHGEAELFALGTVSGRPGLYLARRVGPAARPLGVIVVKIEFDALQRQWSQQAGTTLGADEHAIVIVSGRRDWQFRTLGPLSDVVRARIVANRLFQGASLTPLPFDAARDEVEIGTTAFRVASRQVGLRGGRLVTLMPMTRAIAAARAQARVVIAITLFVLLAMLAWLYRQRELAATQQAIQRGLEDKVAERTAELEQANRQLVIESKERAQSEARYRRSREELAQANRLGTLGQVTAGVAHEINQPVAAIRAFAENATRFLETGKSDKAADNLGQIVGLTTRIAAITSELRGFARQKTPAIGATSLSDAIEAALQLVKHRIASNKVAVRWSREDAAVTVRADRIRLEQIFVNLVQNSLDALAGRDDGQITITVRCDGDRVMVDVADNGPGVAPAMRPRLFLPFSTEKEDGLGLGLAIVRDIARTFGGDIRLVDGPGAHLELTLARA